MKEYFKKNIFVHIIILIVSLIITGGGILFSYKSDLANREDIQLYNKAISVYNESDYILGKYPIDNLLQAIEYFQQATSKNSNNNLRSLAYYNIGTAIGRDFLNSGEERIAGLGIDDAIDMLMEAIRLDPNNKDAKHNLEYLEKLQFALMDKETVSAWDLVDSALSSENEYVGY